MSTQPQDDVNWLVEQAAVDLDSDDFEDRARRAVGWAAIHRLNELGSREVLEAAIAASRDPDPIKRRVGAAVLGQLGYQVPGRFEDERYDALAVLLADEQATSADPAVLRDVCFAFSNMRVARAIPALLELRRHPDPDVRAGVVSGLFWHEDEKAIEGLIELSTDEDDRVRDWATYALALIITTDTPAIRAALRARLDDPDFQTRNEAIEGLATRGDQYVVPALVRELDQQIASPLFEAATALATPALCEALVAARDRVLTWEADNEGYDLTEHWRQAMVACGCVQGEDRT